MQEKNSVIKATQFLMKSSQIPQKNILIEPLRLVCFTCECVTSFSPLLMLLMTNI